MKKVKENPALRYVRADAALKKLGMARELELIQRDREFRERIIGAFVEVGDLSSAFARRVKAIVGWLQEEREIDKHLGKV